MKTIILTAVLLLTANLAFANNFENKFTEAAEKCMNPEWYYLGENKRIAIQRIDISIGNDYGILYTAYCPYCKKMVVKYNDDSVRDDCIHIQADTSIRIFVFKKTDLEIKEERIKELEANIEHLKIQLEGLKNKK